MELTRRNAPSAALKTDELPKRRYRNTSKRVTLFALLPIGGFLLAPAAHAQADITFSGGSGAPLSMTFNTAISYTITSTSLLPTPLFVFQGVGNVINGFNGHGATITSLLNGAAPLIISDIVSGFSFGAFTVNDLLLSGTSRDLIIGDTVTLTAGILTTGNTIAAAAPASGSYTTFLTDSLGNRISANGVPTSGSGVPPGGSGVAPEPTSLALFALSALPVVGAAIRRRVRELLTTKE